MSDYVIKGQTLTGIADAIRAQLGTEQQYTPESMAKAIGSIQGGETEDTLVDGIGLTYYENNRVTSIRAFCFAYSSIQSIKAQNLNELGNSAFQGAGKLTSIATFKATKINSSCFSGCTALEIYAGYVTNISGTNVFQNCGIKHLVLMSDSICTLGAINSFSNSPIGAGTGYVYVSDDLVEQYKVATNWSNYASQIKGWSEIPEEVLEWINQNGGMPA